MWSQQMVKVVQIEIFLVNNNNVIGRQWMYSDED